MTVAQLPPPPMFQAFAPNGGFLVGGQLFTYAAGTSTPQATYIDSTQTTPNTNPVILNAVGEASVWLNATLAYKFVLQDAAGNLLWSVDNINAPALTQSIIGQLLFPQTAAELAAGVTPTFYYYPPGDIRRYGAALNGVTDDTAAVQRWLSVGGALTFPVAQTGLISSACPMVSNTSITATKGATITSATGGISLFSATNKTDISILGLTFVNTATTAGFPVVFAHTYFVGCTRPIVQNCEFVGMNCGAITFDGCIDPIAQNNNISGGIYPATQQQTSDIACFGYTGATLRGVITGNRCYGGGNFGIAIQDAYTFFNPANCVVANNRIGGSQLYGVLVYIPSFAALNTYTQVVNNYIENIQGVTSIIGGTGGAGIYVVGGAAGGTLIQGNSIVNCCINTTGRTLAPAGIGITGTNGAIAFTASVGGATSGTLGTGGSPAPNGNWNGASGNWLVNFSDGEQRLVTLTNGATTCTWTGALSAGSILAATLAPYYNDPITVSDNKISGMTQYDGILVVSNFSGVTVSNNTVNMPASNVTGFALHIANSSNVTVTGGTLVNQGVNPTAYIESPQATTSSITLNGISINGGGNTGGVGCIQIGGDGTHGVTGLNLSNLQVFPAAAGAGVASVYLSTNAANGAQISNCYTNVATMPALLVAGCSNVRASNNVLFSTGTAAIVTSGNCAGSFFDKSNEVSGGFITNGATGFVFHQFGTAAPTTGTHALGDVVYSTLGTTPFLWNCSVTGSPGTWVGLVIP